MAAGRASPSARAVSWRRLEGHLVAYDEATAGLGGDILQASFWAELKECFGWRAERFWHVSRGAVDATAQVLVRRLAPGIRIGYLPRGPTGVAGAAAWREFSEFARREGGGQGSLIWRIDPNVPAAEVPDDDMRRAGFRRLHQPGRFGGIQPRMIFRRQLGQGLLATGQLGRHLRRAFSSGCEVAKEGAEALSELHMLLADTAARNDLRLRAMDYYRALHSALERAGAAKLFVVRHGGRAVAAALIGQFGRRATYLVGASASNARELLPGYRVQAEVISWAEEEGLETYDLRGGPLGEPNHGLNRFKRQFGEAIVLAGERDLPLRPDYWLWRQLEPLRTGWLERRARPALE